MADPLLRSLLLLLWRNKVSFIVSSLSQYSRLKTVQGIVIGFSSRGNLPGRSGWLGRNWRCRNLLLEISLWLRGAYRLADRWGRRRRFRRNPRRRGSLCRRFWRNPLCLVGHGRLLFGQLLAAKP